MHTLNSIIAHFNFITTTNQTSHVANQVVAEKFYFFRQNLYMLRVLLAPRQTCFAASDVFPVVLGDSRVILSYQKSIFTQLLLLYVDRFDSLCTDTHFPQQKPVEREPGDVVNGGRKGVTNTAKRHRNTYKHRTKIEITRKFLNTVLESLGFVKPQYHNLKYKFPKKPHQKSSKTPSPQTLTPPFS